MKKFLIVKSIIRKKESTEIFNHFINVCKHIAPRVFKEKKYSNFSDKKLCIDLIKLKKNNRKALSNIYNTMQISNEILKLGYKKKIQDIASKYLKIKKENFALRNTQFRIDLPFDNENTYGWHQDNAYYRYNIKAKNSIVLWIPLINVNKENGTLIIMPNSYNCDSSFSSKKIIKKTKFSSEQILVKKQYLKKFGKELSVALNKNDALISTAGIFHKSGINKSNICRFTLIVRFNNIFSDDFIYA